ncbi:MAG: FHA domain-containing protein [Armatimonadota bacterium]|nr:FHA domain-containing protein [Armatimonadota bacterium]MDR5696658.1 FHA domain-containing protein [Armatimonadota bacterium]
MNDLILQPLRYVVLAGLFWFLYRAVRVMESELRAAAAAEQTPQTATLVVERGGDGLSRGQTFVVASGAVLGRSPAAQILLPDEFASAQHARLVLHGSAFWVEDLGSKNGTYLNERRVTAPVPIQDGDTLKIGQTVFRFRSTSN